MREREKERNAGGREEVGKIEEDRRGEDRGGRGTTT